MSKKYCAIYTRKSTEEGLEQEFNTLDAQREACQAYILSQKSEGWVEDKTLYDDGGFSGGNIKRPALIKLIEDIKAGKIHIVVVYKIDRLTRSLMDFSKLVEVFDEYGVTFVSITQSFNTTTSMGRLTLNVLLSFAQFEREVAGERIRDKIQASKKKGMWMGGIPPIGYEIKDHYLAINKQEEKLAILIFDKYLELKTVQNLKEYLDENNIKTPVRTTKKGKQYGGGLFGKNPLYNMLKNPVYIGKLKHKDNVYDGVHPAIITNDKFEEVQNVLKENGIIRAELKNNNKKNLLQGKLYNENGILYTPTYTTKAGKEYRYYVDSKLLKNSNYRKNSISRLPALEIEKAVFDILKHHMPKEEIESTISNKLEKVIVSKQKISIKIKDMEIIKSKYTFRTINNGLIIIKPNQEKYDPLDLRPQELKDLVRGVMWREQYFNGTQVIDISKQENLDQSQIHKLIRRTFEIV